jgi:undecaprenyl-diphosphatase
MRAVYLLRSGAKAAKPRIGDVESCDARRWAVLRVLIPVLLVGAVMVGLGWLVTHALVHTWPFDAEDVVDRTLAAHRDTTLNAITGVLSTIADTPCTILLAAAAFVGARLLSHRWRPSAFIAAALAVEVSVFLVTTVLVHRARPGVLELDHSPPTSSFPSGHTAAAVALYGAVAWLIARGTGRWQAWLLLLMPAAVAFARLYRGMHHPSDVVAGFLLGACALVVAAHAVFGPTPRLPRRATLASSSSSSARGVRRRTPSTVPGARR